MLARNLDIFFLIVRLEMKIFKKQILSKAFDSLIWVVSVIGVFSYLGPSMGISQEFIKINMVGTLATICVGEVYPNFVTLLSDLCGNRIISYYTTLPVPYWVVFLAKITFFSITNGVIGVFAFPIVKLMVPELFVLSQINLFGLFVAFVTSSLLMGVFAFFVAAFTQNMSKIGSMWMRLIYPLWFFGGYQFTWSKLSANFPTLAKINLLNPFIYATESFRAVFRQYPTLPFGLCIFVMLFMAFILGAVGIIKMKKRLDCV